MNCKNCGVEIEGSYCHQCGQKVIERFTSASAFSWIVEDVFVLDKGFLFTLKKLLLNPVIVTNEYISGVTKKYFNPYKLLLIVSTIPFVIFSFIPNYDKLPGNLEILKEWPPVFTRASFTYFMSNFPFLVMVNFLAYFLITIPLWSFFSWLLFKKRHLTYIEHLIFVSYLSSGFIALIFLIMPICSLLVYLVEAKSEIAIYCAFSLMLIGFIYGLKGTKNFHQESYFLIVVKGAFMGYLGVIVSIGIQFLVLSSLKLVLGSF